MKRKWIPILLVMLTVLVLSACNKTVEEQASKGIENAETVFTSKPNKANKSIGHIELYLPKGYSIETGIDEANYTIIHGKDSYILFVNSNEPEDSQLHYDILKQDEKTDFIREKTFETDGIFGFSAINKQSEEKSELIVSVGGVKLTTLSDNKKLDDKLQRMMEIVQSVKVID